MADQTLEQDIEKVKDGTAEKTSVSHTDNAELEKRVRERFEARHQREEAIASVRRETYQKVAEAKRAGEPDRNVMGIERAGLRRSAELLTLGAPFPEAPSEIALLATQDLPMSELVKVWATSSERFFGPPYSLGSVMAHKPGGIASANKTTGDFHLRCATQDKGGFFDAIAQFRLDFGLVIPTNPLLAGLPVGGTSVRQGRTRLLPTFSGLGEAYMVAASHMIAKSSCEMRIYIFDDEGHDISLYGEDLWDEQSSSPPGTQVLRWSQTRTFSTPWFPVNSERLYSAYIDFYLIVEGQPDGDNSYAEALGEVAGRLSSIRVSQYLAD
jgi:hypothetical protein